MFNAVEMQDDAKCECGSNRYHQASGECCKITLEPSHFMVNALGTKYATGTIKLQVNAVLVR